MKIYGKIRGIFSKVCQIVSYAGMAAMFGIVWIVTLDVILRGVSKLIPSVALSISGAYEMTQLAMIIMIFMGFAVTQRDKGHVRVDLFVNKLPHGGRSFYESFISFVTFVCSCFVTKGALNRAVSYAADGQTTATLELPYSPFAVIMFIGMLLFTIMLLLEAIDIFLEGIEKQKNSGDAAPDIR